MTYGSKIGDFPHKGSTRKRRRVHTTRTLDGFTPEERRQESGLKIYDWKPRKEYETLLICELEPGPQRVTFTARVVNIYDQLTPSKSPQAAKGCLKILVKDDSGRMSVRCSISPTPLASSSPFPGHIGYQSVRDF